MRNSPHRKRGQKGSAMMLALSIMLFGSLSIGGLHTYLHAAITAQDKADDRMGAFYAADAAMEQLIADLLQGATPAEGQYPPGGWPQDNAVNGHMPSINLLDMTLSYECLSFSMSCQKIFYPPAVLFSTTHRNIVLGHDVSSESLSQVCQIKVTSLPMVGLGRQFPNSCLRRRI